jgi:hypothetical protein
LARTQAPRLGSRLLEQIEMKSSVMSLLIACFIFGGIAWRINYRRQAKGAHAHPVVKIIPLKCKSCK